MTEQALDTEVSTMINRMAVRLPPFWRDKPALWFAQVEAQLNQQNAAEVEDIITAPPAHDPYDRLKAELISSLSTSREQRVRQLLSHEEMGDSNPSQFLRHIKGLAPDIADDFLRTIWTIRLPPHVQAILAGQTEGSLD
jgi:hypothetical protein